MVFRIMSRACSVLVKGLVELVTETTLFLEIISKATDRAFFHARKTICIKKNVETRKKRQNEGRWCPP